MVDIRGWGYTSASAPAIAVHHDLVCPSIHASNLSAPRCTACRRQSVPHHLRSSICGWIGSRSLTASTCAPESVRDKVLWRRGEAQPASKVCCTESTNALCFLCVYISLRPCNWGACSLSLTSLYISFALICSALSC